MIKALSLLFLFFTSCIVPKVNLLPPTFSTIYKNSNGGNDKPGYLHIRSNEDYIKLIESLKIDESEFNTLVTINFKENDIIILYQGQKNTGGYSIDVAAIHWEKDVLFIKKNESFPEAGKPVTMALTNPYCITIIPKAKNIIIEE
jgi:hypothetical protein